MIARTRIVVGAKEHKGAKEIDRRHSFSVIELFGGSCRGTDAALYVCFVQGIHFGATKAGIRRVQAAEKMLVEKAFGIPRSSFEGDARINVDVKANAAQPAPAIPERVGCKATSLHASRWGRCSVRILKITALSA